MLKATDTGDSQPDTGGSQPDTGGSQPDRGDSSSAASSAKNGRPTAKSARRAPTRKRAPKPGRQGTALPRGPQALPRKQVSANQRQRLFAAMVQAVDEQGFVATTISDIVSRAGVSRRTFYEHFENKDQCLLETYDRLIERMNAYLLEIALPGEDWLARVESLAKGIIDVVVWRPDAARLVCTELAAAGPAGVERWARDGAALASLINATGDDRPAVPEPVARAIVGALRRAIYARVRRKRSGNALRGELMKLLPDLLAWVSAYHPSPADIPYQPEPANLSAGSRRTGGRAPGTLSLSPSWMAFTPGAGARGLPPGEHNLPRGFVAHHQRERIFDAIAKRTADRGYPELGLEEIAAAASISLQTFYQHFESKEEAFLATYEVGHAKAVAAVRRAIDLRLDWISNVKLGIATILEFLASEPAYAHIACVDVLIAYPHMAARQDEANSTYTDLLDFGLDVSGSSGPRTPITGEAIVGGVFELLNDYVVRGQAARLPELADHASYVVLAPFLGPERAWEAVQSGPKER